MNKYTIEKQAVSLDLAKELKANGYEQEGVWWWAKSTYHFELALKTGNKFVDAQYRVVAFHSAESIVAPTVAELGERLPHSHYTIYSELFKCWTPVISKDNDGIFTDLELTADTEANARAKMWLYLKKENLL